MAAIDNLGAYGEITKAAKDAGGVSRWINLLETEAVINAAPRLRVEGGIVGVGLTAIAGGVYWLYSRHRRVHTERLDNARNELREVVEDALLQDESAEDTTPNSTTPPI